MYYNSRREYKQAFGFFAFLLIVFILSIYAAFASAGPIVLGTEMNTNGLVEYLCFGMGCDNL
jgi:hypothetical protein